MKIRRNIDCIRTLVSEVVLNNRFGLRENFASPLEKIPKALEQRLRVIFHPDLRQFEQLFGSIFGNAPD